MLTVIKKVMSYFGYNVISDLDYLDLKSYEKYKEWWEKFGDLPFLVGYNNFENLDEYSPKDDYVLFMPEGKRSTDIFEEFSGCNLDYIYVVGDDRFGRQYLQS